jgi:putative ABC transport system permease protein
MLFKTPFRLIHFPGVALAIAGAALVLAAVTVSTRLFLPAAGDAALQQQLGQLGGVPALSVVMYSPIGPDELAALSGQVERIVAARAPRLGRPVRTALGPPVAVAAQGGMAAVQLATRDGFAGHVHRVATAPGTAAGNGVWLPESVATALRLRPGQAVTLGTVPQVRTRVAGIYQDLTGGDRPLDPFWSPLSGALAVKKVGEEPPQLLLAEPPLLAELGRRLSAAARLEWNYYLPPGRLTVPTVETLVPRIDRVRLDVSDPMSVLATRQASANSPLPTAVASAHATELALTGPVETISVTGRILALALLAAAGLYGVKRRRGEVLLLTAQGVGGARLAGRSMVEATLPLLAGGALGWLLAVALAGVLTPTGEPQPQALAAASREVAATLAVGLLLLAAVTWASVQAEERERSRAAFRQLLAKPLWEALVLVLAAAALYELQTRGSQPVQAGGQPARVDRFLVLLPLLLIAGLAGLAARGAGRLLAGGTRPLRAGARPRPAGFLAVRRLAAAPRLVLLLVTGSALAIGVFGYAGILVASTEGAAHDKARVLVGSDTSVSTEAADEGLAGSGLAATRVQRLSDVTLAPDGVPVDLLAVDPATFADAVHWDASWADRPLGVLLDRLDAGAGRLPALLAGPGVPVSNAVQIGSARLPFMIVGNAAAFPGMSRADRPLLVVSTASLASSARGASTAALDAEQEVLARTEHEVWAREDPPAVLAVMRQAGTVPGAVRTAGAVMRTPAFLTVSWTFSMLQALGVLAGLVALIGLVLYVQARQRGRLVAYALARRMGLTRGAHLRSVALELAAMLLFSFALGTMLAVVTSWLVYRRLDPMPELPPALHLRLPGALLGLTLAGVGVAALAGALLVQRGADRANVAEVMRLAG